MIHAGPSDTLVIHPGALGDVLQAVPALRALGRAARLTFAGQPRLGELLLGTGVVARALGFDSLGLEGLFTREPLPPEVGRRLGAFQRIVSWFGAREACYVERLGALAGTVVVAPPVPGGEAGPAVWQHLRATLGLSGAPEGTDLAPLPLPQAWRDAARQTLAGLGVAAPERLLVVHPGAGGAWKRWPAGCYAGAIQRAAPPGSLRVLVHQGPADRQAAEALLGRLAGPALRLVDPPLGVLAGVLAASAAYLGGDSGVSHLAAAVGAPAVILFPAETRRRWEPWSPTAAPVTLRGAPEDVEQAARLLAGERGGPTSDGCGPPGPPPAGRP